MAKNEMAVNKGQQISPTQVAQSNMKNLLNGELRGLFKNALQDNAGPFMASLIDLYSDPQGSLAKCDAKDVAMEALKAAILKLPINKALGYAYIVPYKGKPTFTIGYKGLIQMAQNSGWYVSINAGTIYEGMELKQNYLAGTFEIHENPQSDEALGYFAYFKLVNGFEKALYMSKEEMEDYMKKYSPSYSSKYSPWQTEFEKMAHKTVLRQLLSVYGKLSPEMQNIVKEEEDAVLLKEVEQNANVQVLGIEEEPQTIEVEGTIVDAETGEVIEEEPAINFDDVPGVVPF